MKKDYIIIHERDCPYWQIILAALLFTAAFVIVVYTLILVDYSQEDYYKPIARSIKNAILILGPAVMLSYKKNIYIDLKNSRFKPTFEVGPLIFGSWNTINNYEYVAVFKQPLIDGNSTLKVNLWYDRNKHFTLYEKPDYGDAFNMAFNLSDDLNIDLLDATKPNNYKWIDKAATLAQGKPVYYEE